MNEAFEQEQMSKLKLPLSQTVLSEDELIIVKAALIALHMELGKPVSEADKVFYNVMRPILLKDCKL
jgi:hypothetical protein